MLQWISSLHKRKDEEMTENQKMDLILQKLGGIEGGLVSVGEDVQSLQGDMQVLKGDVQVLKGDVQVLKGDVQELKGDVQVLKEDVQVLKGDVQVLKGDVQELKEDVQELKEDVQELKEDVQVLKERVTNIEITLENETNRNIQLIAEGHLNLDRKLDEALKELHPNTMYHLKVNHLDGEVTKMKRILNMA
jgi:chromosome segregation ATPase